MQISSQHTTRHQWYWLYDQLKDNRTMQDSHFSRRLLKLPRADMPGVRMSSKVQPLFVQQIWHSNLLLVSNQAQMHSASSVSPQLPWQEPASSRTCAVTSTAVPGP